MWWRHSHEEAAVRESAMPAMFEWDVYVDSKYIGCVFAKDEASAVLAGWSQFNPPEGSDVSVNKR